MRAIGLLLIIYLVSLCLAQSEAPGKYRGEITLKQNEVWVIQDTVGRWFYNILIRTNITNQNPNKKLSCYVMTKNDHDLYKNNNYQQLPTPYKGLIAFENLGFNANKDFDSVEFEKEKYFIFKNNGTETIQTLYDIAVTTGGKEFAIIVGSIVGGTAIIIIGIPIILVILGLILTCIKYIVNKTCIKK